jgi:superfamily II DNA or RNA helicase
MSEDPRRRRLARTDRERLFQRSQGVCEREGCSTPIDIDTFHASHLRAHANGGAAVFENFEAWCSRCNLTLGARDAGDPRVAPREWQLLALDRVVGRITRTRVATVAAAPGAGKTVFAGLAYEALRDADVVDRMVVFAPRTPLVQQWHDSLRRLRHIELRPNGEVERRGEQGVVVTYQSLNAGTIGVHRHQADVRRTLYVLDEVHHLGEPDHSAWARFIAELVGDVDDGIEAAGVLNLSGTLWRSRAAERISTVRYMTDADGRLVSDVDHEVTAPELIRQGQLRPVDLFRRGATVELIDLAESTRLVSPISELGERSAGRAALRELSNDPAWRDEFVREVIVRLIGRSRDLGNGPAKALIVARSQELARAFQEAANRIMRESGMHPIAELAVSDDGSEAHATLERFKKLKRPGILCTVDMAGEGYDCPDIIVIGYASNKLTPLYVRQVVARAQRVTDYERDVVGRPLPAAVVIADVPELVAGMSAILDPMRHEVVHADSPDEARSNARDAFGLLQMPRYVLDSVTDHVEGDARVTGEAGGDVEMDLVRRVEPEARRVGLPESEAPRIVLSVRRALAGRRESLPFDPLSSTESALETALEPGSAPSSTATVEPLSVDRIASGLRRDIDTLGRWWQHCGDPDVPVAHFHSAANRAGGIGKGGRPNAEVEQLRAALDHARLVVTRYCDETGQKRPRLMRQDDES